MPSKRIAVFKHGPRRQHGGALLILLVILVVGIAVVLVNSLTASSIKTARQTKTAAALAQAKDALIGYAITYGDNPAHSLPQVDGYLPCPDQTGGANEGSATGSCGSKDISQMGRLPWKTLGLTTLRDGDGECLWYAVSGTYKNNPKTGLMNWDTNGQLQVYASDGTTLLTPADNLAVAVIMAPGARQGTQDRTSDTSSPTCGGNYTASNYLDSDGTINNATVSSTAQATSTFRLGTASGINDQMIFITKIDIWNAIQKRTDFQNTLNLLTQQVALCLANYGRNNGGFWGPYDHSLPRPAPLALSNYSVNANYQDSSTALYAGRVPYSVTNSKALSNNAFSNLMTTANCPSGWAGVDIWWNNWKDHLFYSLGQAFKPSNNLYQSCGWPNVCISIASSNKYAAIVMFAGPRLSALYQTRAVKSDITQYLEGVNASNFTSASGNEIYQTGSASSTFNDVLYCIDSNLNVGPC